MRWFACCLLFLTISAMAQVETPPKDSEIQDIIQKLEGTEEPEAAPEEASGVELGKTPEETALLTRVNACWQAKLAQDWAQVYTFFWKIYRDEVAPEGYLRMDKLVITHAEVQAIEAMTDQCARVKVTYGVEHPMMTIKRIRVTESWTLEDGEWFLVADPHANIIGLRPGGTKKVIDPCASIEPEPEQADVAATETETEAP